MIPLGEYAECPVCGYSVRLRTKGQRCPVHNIELIVVVDKGYRELSSYS
ncbi:MAG: hypothetical protein PHH48_06500 [Eubacteriales bacterium]|nr:hypothetical protein [Eubacteriales bacterium]